MNFYEKLESTGFSLPEAPARGGLYSPYRFDRQILYVSGCGPNIGDEHINGKLGSEFTVAEGQNYTRQCLLNALTIAKMAVADLDRLDSMLRLTVFVSSTDGFYDQPAVADGGCILLADLFGADKLPVRSALGVNALAGNIPVEIEAAFLIKE